jgi:hypothetical protein
VDGLTLEDQTVKDFRQYLLRRQKNMEIAEMRKRAQVTFLEQA